MKMKDMELVVKTFYDKLEEGIILGRKCKRCGHIEYPPYLACNTCGCLETEWVEMKHEAMCTMLHKEMAIFSEPEFRQNVGDYWVAAVQPEGSDETGTSLVNIDPARFDEYYAKLPFPVRPVIVQDVDTKIVLWEPADNPPRESIFLNNKVKPFEEEAAPAGEKAATTAEDSTDDAMDPVAQCVFEAAAVGYDVDVSTLTFDTDIREDLANESMKMVVMLSEIEDNLDVIIEIPEAGNLNTLRDFIRFVKEKMS